ncbi:hypothetical protein ACC659_38445, partial [Rhizobium johnstonii]
TVRLHALSDPQLLFSSVPSPRRANNSLPSAIIIANSAAFTYKGLYCIAASAYLHCDLSAGVRGSLCYLLAIEAMLLFLAKLRVPGEPIPPPKGRLTEQRTPLRPLFN